MKSIVSILFAAALALLLPASLQAASVLPMEIDGVIDGAAIAFQGRCLDNRSEVDTATGHIVTFTTFEVQDALKGPVGSTHTIKQLGGQVGNLVSRFDGVPRFEPGVSYVVFLYGVSSLGFSSPVGLAQGRFEVRAGALGLEVANGSDFRRMLERIPQAAMPESVRSQLQKRPGRIERLELEEFKRLVRQRVAR